VADKDDAFPTKVGEWQDSDGDHVGDNEDAFPDDPSEWKDSDNDGVGDNADAFPFDPNETQDSDSDGVGDHEDAFPFDPLEQVDSDGDGVGDNGDAAPADPSIQRIPIGPITAAFALDLRTKAALNAFADSLASRDTATFAFDGDHRFLLVLPGGEQLQGSTVPVGRAGSKFLLQLDVATLSALEGDFASDGDSIVANDTASTPSPALSFVPRAVLSDGVVKLTKKGVSLSLRVRFTYARDQVGARGAHGRLLWRATGTPES